MDGSVTRRRFLTGGAAAVGAGLVAGCSRDGDDRVAPASEGQGQSGERTAHRPPARVAFHGAHQNGIVAPAPAAGVLAALDVLAPDRAALVRTMKDISAEAERLMTGEPPRSEGDPRRPPEDNGVLGESPPVADLAVVASVGASLFDDRFGLADRKPRELVRMTRIANDKLQPDRCHGDLLLVVEGDSPDVTLASLRQILRQVRATTVLRWTLEGHNRASASGPGEAPVRNLLGFKDGTANLDTGDEMVMGRHIWVGPDDDEPDWAIGGSYQVTRAIRMFVEFWDRTSLNEQEALIGRRKHNGAPLDGEVETDVPDYAADPDGEVTPLDAHIRLANPRTAETEDNLILRRGLSYSRGLDGAGRLDQGLAFVSYQRSLEKGFLTVARRLAGEPLEEYIQPEGGGFFFALPGVGRGGWLGESLLT